MSLFKIDGLISGMKTGDIIDQLMSIERQPMIQLQQKQDSIKKVQSAWKDLASKIQALETAAAALLQRSTMLGNTAQVTTTGAPLTVSANEKATPGTYSVLVSQLATQTTARSAGALAADIDSSAKLEDIALGRTVTGGRFTINGVGIDVDPAVDSLDDVIARINASGAGVTASLVAVDGYKRLSIAANTAGGPLQLGSAGDTSNFLAATNVLAAPRVGDAVTSTSKLATTRTGDPLSAANLAVPVSGTGTLTINGVDIAYDASVDSINAIINRINASSAGVTASYDATSDTFLLRNKQTGSLWMSLSDTGGFLAAMKIDPNTSIQVGQNAQYSLDGGATTLYSTSNTVSDAIPGVTMTFTGTTTTPAQLTVSQDIDSAVNAVKKFVDAYNAAMAAIDSDTAYDSDKKQASVLTGDSSVMMLQQALRSMIVSPAVNVASGYKTLGDIGISFGSYGSKVGTTDTLQVDETKLRAALQNNGTGVFDLLGAGSSATLTTPGDIASIFGAPSNPPDSGRYEISSDGAGNFTVTFIDQSNVTRWTKTGTIQAGQSDVTLIPGLTLTAASSFTGATTTITVTRRDGVLAAFDRYLKGTLDSADGLFKLQDQSADDQIKRLDDDISRMQDRLDQRQATLEAQFTAMETFLAQLQAQTGGALAQLASMSAGASLLGS